MVEAYSGAEYLGTSAKGSHSQYRYLVEAGSNLKLCRIEQVGCPLQKLWPLRLV